jgi:hypothetical protein
MHLAFRTIAVSTLALIISSTLAPAAEVRVLTVGSTQVAAKAIAADFEMQTRNQVTFTIRPPFDIDKELAEKTFDAVILSVPAMDNHDEAGDIVPISRVALARVGVGAVVKQGGPVPDVSTPEKLKAAVLAARSLTYTDPATPNTPGAIAGAALAKLVGARRRASEWHINLRHNRRASRDMDRKEAAIIIDHGGSRWGVDGLLKHRASPSQ